MQKLYPINLNIEGRRCLVVGGGAVALRKVRGLIEAGGDVHVISPQIAPEIEDLPVQIDRRPFTESDVDGAALVIAATDDEAVNTSAARAAAGRGIPVNVVDVPELCSFFLPAVVRRGGLAISVSTSGASPALARIIRERLEKEFGPEYADYLELLDASRKQVLENISSPDKRRAIFESIANSDLLDVLRTSGRAAAESKLQRIIDAGM